MRTGSLICIFLMAAMAASAQKVIVVMGSSTAAGSGASPQDSAWVNRLQSYYQRNTTDGVDTVIQNLGFFGATTYQEMPDGFVPTVPNRPAVNSNINVTKALSYNPNIVIINLPNNDIVNLFAPAADPHEIMNNFRIMYNTITATGAKCFITTSQPRNDINPSTNFYQRQQLRDLVDSINLAFGVHAINFWDDLVSTDGLYSLRDDVRDPASDYHLNNTGHRLVYQRVVAKSIFTVDATLPLSLTNFEAHPEGNNVRLNWSTASEDPGTIFNLQRGTDGLRFETVATQRGHGNGDYSWTDAATRTQTVFYRLQIISQGRTAYSRIVSVTAGTPLSIGQIYLQATRLHASIFSSRPQAAHLSVVNTNGAVVLRQREQLAVRNNNIELSLAGLPAGAYFLRISTDDAPGQTWPFTLVR